MKRVIIRGQVRLDFTKIMDVTDDEVDELISSERGLECNVDLEDCDWDTGEFIMISARVNGVEVKL